MSKRPLEDCSKSVMLEKRSFTDVVKKAHGVVGEVVWLQLGVMEVQHREELLK